MRLEHNIVRVHEVQVGAKTSVKDGVLSVNLQGLQQVLAQDSRLGKIDIEVANPGEKCRITQVSDVVEPRAKIRNSGLNFPGILDKQGSAGLGTACVLRGAAVTVTDHRPTVEVRNSESNDNIIDMWGPGAEYGPYGKTSNVVIVARPTEGVSADDRRTALKVAGLRAAVYLAAAASDLTPDEQEVFETEPLASNGNRQGLPRVAYIFQIFSNQTLPIPGDPVFYGDNVDKIVPTIVHPNEVLDGAITTRAIETYMLQNHPIIKELYRNHGKTLYLAGVIITTAPNNGPSIARAANIAANQAKWILGVDGVILTKYGGGAPEMTMAAMGQRCEQLGIKAALAIQHSSQDDTDISMKASTIFTSVPEVDAIISYGTNLAGPRLTLPAAERLIGPDKPSMAAETERQASQIKGAMSLVGSSRLMVVRY